MKLGSKVIIHRKDIDPVFGINREFHLGQGFVIARTNSFVRIFGVGDEYPFDEWVPIRSRRVWITLAA